MLPASPLARLLWAWPLAGAVMGAFTVFAHTTGIREDTPLLAYIAIIWIPLVIGTMAWQRPSHASFSAGCQGAAVATAATVLTAGAGFCISVLAAALLGPTPAQNLAILGALTSFLTIGIGAAFTPIAPTTRREVAAAAAAWMIGLFGAAGLLFAVVFLVPHATTPDHVFAFLLGCVLCTPTFASIALRDRLLSSHTR